MGIQTVAVDVVVEPLGQPGAAPLQPAAGEGSTVDGGMATSRAPGGGHEHLIARPPADAASTSPSAVVTWCTSASMSIVGVQVSPRSSVRKMPPTCTFT